MPLFKAQAEKIGVHIHQWCGSGAVAARQQCDSSTGNDKKQTNNHKENIGIFHAAARGMNGPRERKQNSAPSPRAAPLPHRTKIRLRIFSVSEFWPHCCRFRTAAALPIWTCSFRRNSTRQGGARTHLTVHMPLGTTAKLKLFWSIINKQREINSNGQTRDITRQT